MLFAGLARDSVDSAINFGGMTCNRVFISRGYTLGKKGKSCPFRPKIILVRYADYSRFFIDASREFAYLIEQRKTKDSHDS